MKIILTACLLVMTNYCFGQFAVVRDKDGYSNVRNADSSSNIIDKLNNGHFVFLLDTDGDWAQINYAKNNAELSGKMYRNRLVLVSSYKKIPLTVTQKDKVVLTDSSIKVVVAKQKFDKAKHKLTYYSDNKAQIKFVDNRQYWGQDGGVPLYEYKAVEVYYKTKKIVFPAEALKNVFEPTLFNTQVNYDKQNDILYLQSSNSDGAGGYNVIWKIEKGIYKGRYIAYGF
ncbi:hypothetical protein LRS06_04345 [Hymenobacter sp. J193]|uniref:hypothetical protein n=1 Tax=Hymenobacter sp. J193 TaxID=2898429 RepID=UPI0021516436|nr:hypothetical protein [Hymenobacter sp. J193]MCR5887019.1 hypothetical protein [Hymenobacter sp. J193]